MRITGGTLRGRRIACPPGVIRPAMDRMRESVFSIVGPIEGLRFLDLFAGSGSVGIEALSRGAELAVFVEQERKILKALRTNLQRCRISDEQAVVAGYDVFRYIDRLLAGDEYFDIIFADPPYAGKTAGRVIAAIAGAKREVCRRLVVEHGEALPALEADGLELDKTKRFGQTIITYFKTGASSGT